MQSLSNYLFEEVGKRGGVVKMEVADKKDVDLVCINLIKVWQCIDAFAGGMNAAVQLYKSPVR